MTYQIIVKDEVRFCPQWLIDADIIAEDFRLTCIVVDTETGETVRKFRDGIRIYMA